ncbi:glycosyltransferase [Xanthocytophaga agilis]|uniref:Glycosyltransferase n=1 Tax=Xanthocytophaga agilis TaxID=3048010 RepID=A0AAE3R2H6_9BACT|nr:glycosyltransferase [Xanthocytophaga agilis]MDJ1500412.1 glycosyltransferase [Xanthocytophaga agilis]
MNILHVSYSDYEGGADKAALRICKAQRSIGINAQMLVIKKVTDLPFVHSAIPKWRLPEFKIKDRLAQTLLRMQPNTNPMLHSLNLFPGFIHHTINKSKADIVNLHWIAKEMISVSEIGKIHKPIVWTLHDSWAFCGTEHHPNGLEDDGFAKGYANTNHFLDFNRWNLAHKIQAWRKKHFQIVTPSQWEASLARRSSLFNKENIEVIANPLNTDVFHPFNLLEARLSLGIPLTKKVILFGSLRSVEDRNKGYDLLQEAFAIFKEKYGVHNCLAVIFGMNEDEETIHLDCPRQYVGRITSEQQMALLYSAADVMVVPSRMENLPQTATEPIACGTPVVGFQVGGMPDIISHKLNGYLAQPYKPEDLADGINWVLSNSLAYNLSENARKIALQSLSETRIASQYEEIYRKIMVSSTQFSERIFV